MLRRGQGESEWSRHLRRRGMRSLENFELWGPASRLMQPTQDPRPERGAGSAGARADPLAESWWDTLAIPPRLLLALLDERRHVAFRIGEESERDPARHLNRWLNGLPTEAFDLVQCRLRVVNTNVERDVPRTLWRFANPAVDATPLLLLVHHAVFQRAVIRRAELPTERFRVELSQHARVAPQDLEVDDRIPHFVLHGGSMRCGI